MFNYNPYPYGGSFGPDPYQQRLSQLEQQRFQQSPVQLAEAPQRASMLKGRVVASMEEARASQVDFDGSTTYFVSPAEKKIYAKSIGMDGLPVFLTYSLQDTNSVSKIENNLDFENRIKAIEDRVKELLENGLTKSTATGQQ